MLIVILESAHNLNTILGKHFFKSYVVLAKFVLKQLLISAFSPQTKVFN